MSNSPLDISLIVRNAFLFEQDETINSASMNLIANHALKNHKVAREEAEIILTTLESVWRATLDSSDEHHMLRRRLSHQVIKFRSELNAKKTVIEHMFDSNIEFFNKKAFLALCSFFIKKKYQKKLNELKKKTDELLVLLNKPKKFNLTESLKGDDSSSGLDDSTTNLLIAKARENLKLYTGKLSDVIIMILNHPTKGLTEKQMILKIKGVIYMGNRQFGSLLDGFLTKEEFIDGIKYLSKGGRFERLALKVMDEANILLSKNPKNLEESKSGNVDESTIRLIQDKALDIQEAVEKELINLKKALVKNCKSVLAPKQLKRQTTLLIREKINLLIADLNMKIHEMYFDSKTKNYYNSESYAIAKYFINGEYKQELLEIQKEANELLSNNLNGSNLTENVSTGVDQDKLDVKTAKILYDRAKHIYINDKTDIKSIYDTLWSNSTSVPFEEPSPQEWDRIVLMNLFIDKYEKLTSNLQKKWDILFHIHSWLYGENWSLPASAERSSEQMEVNFKALNNYSIIDHANLLKFFIKREYAGQMEELNKDYLELNALNESKGSRKEGTMDSNMAKFLYDKAKTIYGADRLFVLNKYNELENDLSYMFPPFFGENMRNGHPKQKLQNKYWELNMLTSSAWNALKAEHERLESGHIPTKAELKKHIDLLKFFIKRKYADQIEELNQEYLKLNGL
jgi:hypothetical protein